MKPTIYIIGDSTAAKKDADKRPESGWGEHLEQFLPGVVVKNHAMNGRSTKSFLDEGLFQAVEEGMQEGDYLLIQFGHNDQKEEDPTRYTEPFESYQENLRIFTEAAQKKQATPVILTSVSRRAFKDGELDPNTLGAYPDAALAFAKVQGVVSLDLFKRTQELLVSLGEMQSAALFLQLEKGVHPNYPDGVVDNTHFNETGARRVAELVAEELKHAIPSITQQKGND
ncbi:rhamnogalacturonan acetylesterase [Jeotgalibaca caeni]|uniref:rhamnogalacturonan acetylesterase n=1 Tax=Jeotgalibaca caeni TaxID=3028623 RepID=UPI00237D8A4D|nr:rhamnogalacturonan acetylesterase [Jeotgalibaca caeni]MDE1549435.1 rhamnogalacturonan acetylesterase [Jeotgalibaca caeni]